MNPPKNVKEIIIVPSFHYDVAYLKSYEEYLPTCFDIIHEALRILENESSYRFLIEQVILLQEYWDRFPEKRDLLVRFAQSGQLAVAPGMFVMPDMNHPDGESLFLQIKYGKQWLRDHLGIEPDICWIADCWGHHAQLPQMLSLAGYRYYVFWRCMRRDVLKSDFIWRGLDGTTIRVHWLARGYSGVLFPRNKDTMHAADQSFIDAAERAILETSKEFQKYGDTDSILLCNGGDFLYPQSSAPDAVKKLNGLPDAPAIRLGTPRDYLEKVKWNHVSEFNGEFNSAFQGTFTSNIQLKQKNRDLCSRLLALETLAVILDERSIDTNKLWKPLLKQQFHDIICGTITDRALCESLEEFGKVERDLEREFSSLGQDKGKKAFFNPLSFSRCETVKQGNRMYRLDLPPLGFAWVDTAEEIPGTGPGDLPCEFRNDFYRAKIDGKGYIVSLIENQSEKELVKSDVAPFGSLCMQMDYGDLWLNFEAPLSGGSVESSLTQNHADPYDRSVPDEIVNRSTFQPKIETARIVENSEDRLVIEQQGCLAFWRLRIGFTIRTVFIAYHPRIEYETRLTPHGKNYRIRAAFPTALRSGIVRHEIPLGIQERGKGEHVAQRWIDYSDTEAGLALINAGTPGNNVDDGVLLLSLFRSVAMEYKTESAASYNDGVPHMFRYAVMPHGGNDDVAVVQNAQAFNSLPIPCTVPSDRISVDSIRVEPGNVLISGLRRSEAGVFMRVYEAVGRQTSGTIAPPSRFVTYTEADGIERPVKPWCTCEGRIEFFLRPYEIRGYLFSDGKPIDRNGKESSRI